MKLNILVCFALFAISAAEKTVTVTETVTHIQAAETPSGGSPLSGKSPWYAEHKKKDGVIHTGCPLSEKW